MNRRWMKLRKLIVSLRRCQLFSGVQISEYHVVICIIISKPSDGNSDTEGTVTGQVTPLRRTLSPFP